MQKLAQALVLSAAVASTFSLSGCATTDTQASANTPAAASSTAAPNMAFVTAIQQDAELSTFVSLVQSAGLADALAAGNLTVFAPTNDAFKALPAATLDKLSKDPELLKSVLNYHVISPKTAAAAIEGSVSVTTLNGAKMGLGRAGDFVTADDALIIQTDIAAAGSLVHKIDRVLMPAVKK